MKLRNFFVLVLFGSLIIGCAKKEPRIVEKPIFTPEIEEEEVIVSKEDIIPSPYRYFPAKRRDPFVPLIKERIRVARKTRVSAEILPTEKEREGIALIDRLSLRGVIWDDTEAMAMFAGEKGESFILRDESLIGPMGSKVEGIKGKIEGRMVILIQKGKRRIFTYGRSVWDLK
jgi:hypothetical protein